MGTPLFEARDVLELLWRRKGRLLLGLVAGLLIGAALWWLLPRQYTAQSVVLVKHSALPVEFVQTPVNNSMRERLQILEHLVASDEAIRDVVERLGRDVDSAEGAQLAADLRRDLEIEIVNAAAESTAVFSIAYTAADPEHAAEVVGAVTSRLMERRAQERIAVSRATAEFLTNEVARMGRELADSAPAGLVGDAEAEGPGERQMAMRARFAALQRVREELARAEATYTGRHPEVQRLRAEYRAQRARLALPPAEGGARAGGADPARDYESRLKSYERLLSRQVEASIAQELETSGTAGEMEVLRAAWPPNRASSPDLALLLAGGAGAGLMLAAALVLLPALRRPSFGSVERLAEVSGLPVVAALPPLRLRRPVRRAAQRLGVAPGLVVATDPGSVAAEQYRSLLPILDDDEATPVVLVTSASRGDGKSLTAANLAASAAMDTARRVLLVDADLRRPSAHRLLGVDREPGVSNAVRDGTVAPHLVATTLPRLSLLPAGEAVRNALEVLTSEAFLKLIDEARRDFQAVFIDAPPILPVVDARILERRCSMVLFVVRADATRRQDVLRGLAEIRGRAGVVLNGVDPSSYRSTYGTDAYRPVYGSNAGRAWPSR